MKGKFYRKVLKNGMVVLLEKRKLPVVSVAFAVRQGGINESLDERGISHFIEHMLFKGTKRRTSKQISEEIERRGGELNAFTDEEITAVWCKIPSKHIGIALDVLTDSIKNSSFPEKELGKERKVIFEEMKIHKDNPQYYVFLKLPSILYEAPLGTPLIGTEETMNSIDRRKLLDRFKTSYTPNNLILCAVGDVEFKKLVDFAEKNFGNKKTKLMQQKIILKHDQKIEKRKAISQANLLYAFHSPLSTDNKFYAAQILIELMAAGLSSRLFQEIREKRNLAYAIFGKLNSSAFYSYSYIYVGTMKENLEKVKAIILKEFEKVSRNLEEKELSQIKEQIIGNYYISMEDSRSQMANLLNYEIDGNAERYYDFEEKIKKVKLADVKNLAGKAGKEYSFFALVPE